MQDDPLIEPAAAGRFTKCQLHAVLVRIFDTGVLLIGESAIGKSECALDLITKGHRLIADDAVEILVLNKTLLGRAPQLTRNLLEIRGLGIINVPEVFGEGAIAEESTIDLCVELKKWIDAEPLEDVVSQYGLAGSILPKFILPVTPSRNLATLVETAVRVHRIGGTFKASDLLIEEHARSLQSAP